MKYGRKKITLNIFAPIQIVACVILGVTGLVSWWVIGLIWLMELSLNFTWEK